MRELEFRLLLDGVVVGYERHRRGVAKYASIMHSSDQTSWSNIHFFVKDWIDHDDKDQFTGLLDKNGVKIFEGDLVKMEGYNPATYVVEFIEGGYCCTHPDFDGYPLDINQTRDSTGNHQEVIGNIHEHPELLNQVAKDGDIQATDRPR